MSYMNKVEPRTVLNGCASKSGNKEDHLSKYLDIELNILFKIMCYTKLLHLNFANLEKWLINILWFRKKWGRRSMLKDLFTATFFVEDQHPVQALTLKPKYFSPGPSDMPHMYTDLNTFVCVCSKESTPHQKHCERKHWETDRCLSPSSSYLGLTMSLVLWASGYPNAHTQSCDKQALFVCICQCMFMFSSLTKTERKPIPDARNW